MARVRLEKYRLGPTTLTSGGGEQTVGQVSLATLTSGMTNNQQFGVICRVWIFGQGSVVYSCNFDLVTAIHLNTTGPTYTKGAVATDFRFGTDGATPQTLATFASVATLDISSGNLRLRINPSSDSNTLAYAIVGTLAP